MSDLRCLRLILACLLIWILSCVPPRLETPCGRNHLRPFTMGPAGHGTLGVLSMSFFHEWMKKYCSVEGGLGCVSGQREAMPHIHCVALIKLLLCRPHLRKKGIEERKGWGGVCQAENKGEGKLREKYMCAWMCFSSPFPETRIWKAVHGKDRKGRGLLKLNPRVKEETGIL